MQKVHAVLKIVFVAVLVLAACLVAYAATRPSTLHIERRIQIRAPAGKLFPLINDFHRWDAWTPFNKDPAMKKTYSGSPAGTGAKYAWEGNRDVGSGDITIIDSAPPRQVVFATHLVTPIFEGRGLATITLDPVGEMTTVTWAVADTHSLVLKLIGIFVNLEKKIGDDYEAGLAKLKEVAES